MKLSIVIVNYNVRYFLQNCLHSVFGALNGLDAEVFVVDNDSKDGSVEMVREQFPDVQVIHNKKNLGFSKANNQAIQQAKGEYILLLNPDTLVESDTFSKCIQFMDEHAECGGLGVKMVDGSGQYLPESKRGLPTPAVAFYKIFGLSALFPQSHRFGIYHLGFINEDEISEIEILSGAFMLLRKETLEKTGLLDENFFMYGEDIDLSWRIVKAGYKNYYFPKTRIIHYKGESTKKSSVNYVFVFYRAMVIFAKKHFSKNNAKLFSLFINLAIYLRAGIALIVRFVKRITLPITDFALLVSVMYLLKEVYERKIKFIQGGSFPEEVIMISLPVMAGIWVLMNTLFGAYHEPAKINRLLRGISAGSIVILITYALIDESLRFSRALVILFCLESFLLLPAYRYLLTLTGIIKGPPSIYRRIAIVGCQEEIKRVEKLLSESGILIGKLIRIEANHLKNKHLTGYDGKFEQLEDLKQMYSINECIFCTKDIGIGSIIHHMVQSKVKCEYKIAPPKSEYIIGSSSNETSGEYYIAGNNSIGRKSNRRKKRWMDVVLSFGLLMSSPFLMVFFDKPKNFAANMWNILHNRLTFVSIPDELTELMDEMKLKFGLIHCCSENGTKFESTDDAINAYIRNYSVWKDISIIFRYFKKLDTERAVIVAQND